jgi:hypothetical protein
LENPPAVHPREPPETPALPQPDSVLKTSHICTGDTLLESQSARKRKFIHGCAQTVEDEHCLWKVPEKAEGNAATDFHGSTRIKAEGFAERKTKA